MGEAARTLDTLLELARAASERVMTERDDARSAAVAAMRSIEQRLQVAISGDVLRGCRDLGKPFGSFQAVAVGRGLSHGIDTRVPWRKRALYVSRDGALTIAWIEDGQLRAEPAGDDELRVEDLEHVAAAVRQALERHVAQCERTAASYERAARLSERLSRD